jgi:hypothetical protein
MTAARRQRKRRLPLTLALWLILGGVWGGILSPAVGQATADDIEVNPHSGLAISGFDPLAYFIDHRPRLGQPGLELTLDGTVWRFLNPGDRAAFAAHPEVYAPRFGGYDAVAVARGASVPGHPLFWAVVRERLYLFYDDATRAAFLADPGRIIVAAERNWPTVARGIDH